MIKIRHILTLALFAAAAVSAQLLPYPERATKYASDPTWDADLKLHWADWKLQFATTGVIKATTPDGLSANVSEAQSYGLLLAVWFNDEAAFKKIWISTKSTFWTGTHFRWKLGGCGGCDNFAGDADPDIAGALIFASALQDSGYWKDKTYDYKAEAKTVMANWPGKLINSNNTIAAWNGAGNETLNPSYFEYHWYPVFKEFSAANGLTGIDWTAVRNATYGVLNKQKNANKGMASNWSNSSGNGISPGTGSKPTEQDMGFDAIRVPWRVGLDNLWYRNPVAAKWCMDVWTGGVVKPGQAGMYSNIASTPTLWGWTANEYEKPLTMAMWGACAITVKDSSATHATAANTIKSYINTRLRAYPYFTTFDEAPRSNYYAQTMGIFGSLVLSGRSWNVWDDLKNKWTAADTGVKVTVALNANPASIAASTSSTTVSTKIRAKFSKSIAWRLTLTGQTSGATYWITGTGDSINLDWNSKLQKIGATFTAPEVVNVVVTEPWTTPPAGAKTTITLTPATSVSARLVRINNLSWTAQGLRVPEGTLIEGVVYNVRILDLQGRQISSTMSAAASSSTQLDLPTPAMRKGLQIVEVAGSNGQVFQAVLPLAR